MTFHIAIPYTAEEEQTVRSMQAKGFGTGAIANRLHRSESSIVASLLRLDKRARTGQMQTRRCLCCGNNFKSEGAHNRLCCRCRAKEKTPFDF